MTTHSVLSCTRPGNKIPYPLPMSLPLGAIENLIIVEDSDEELDGRDNEFYTAELMFSTTVSFLFTLSRMHGSTTSIIQMSSIHMWSLLSMSTRTPSVWLSKKLKLVTSTIVGIFFSSSTHAHHAPPYSFSSMINMHLPQGKHAFFLCLPCFYICVLHVFASRLTHFFTYLNQ